MKIQILIFLIGVTIFSCGENKREEMSVDHEISQRYFPQEKKTTSFDTIISRSNLKVSIRNRSLDSYVTNEFESDGTKYIDHYRDHEIHLIIELSNEVIIDTIFRKEDFAEYAGQEFLKVANFRGYWFDKVEDDKIELFGVINKPETDWSYAFYHYFDLNSRKFNVKEYIDEEI